MSDYFSFQKSITAPFVKAIYFLGFIALTAGGIGFAGWAGMRLYEASIPRELGWYYVAIGLGCCSSETLYGEFFAKSGLCSSIYTRGLFLWIRKLELKLSQLSCAPRSRETRSSRRYDAIATWIFRAIREACSDCRRDQVEAIIRGG